MDSLYDDFVSDYNNMNITAHDVRRINQLNSKQYSRIRNQALNNGDIPPVRHMNKTNAKFYCKRKNGLYEVLKTIDGKQVSIGKFANEDTAKKVVCECIKCNWEINKIKNFIDVNRVRPKNYSIVNGYYIIQKTIDGQNIIFASIHSSKVSVEMVEDIVEEFRKVDWNVNCKESILNMFNS